MHELLLFEHVLSIPNLILPLGTMVCKDLNSIQFRQKPTFSFLNLIKSYDYTLFSFKDHLFNDH
jgi:hypothetical protein